ncbi:MAG TPA: hypothetical protein VIF15_21155 [Polyangiaceae bacterium]|jgi:hypothetical protein
MRAAVERDALVVGMTLVPGLYSRNRAFALFEDPEVRRARWRSGVLRGIVRQLVGAHGRVEDLTVVRGVDAFELRYRVPGLRIDRRASLSELELACVRYLAGRAGVPDLHASDEDRAWIDAALKRLTAGLRLAELEAGNPSGA